MELLSQVFSVFLLVVGFGFVIFWHELGHFLAAKWVGIKVEQFAVGMGHAIVSYRKGIGLKLGNSRGEYDRRVSEYLDQQQQQQQSQELQLKEKSSGHTDAQKERAAQELGIGETEYRLSWIPIGGYVKMLGQDDMDPTAQAEDPRAYNKKSVGARMLVISAGVIMNIILAGILFMVLFLYGFKAPAPVVGTVVPNSPAQAAGVRVGDELVSFDGKPMHDFTKVMLNTALAKPNEDLPLVVRRPDGTTETLTVRPRRPSGDAKGFVALGLTPSKDLRGPKKEVKAGNPALEPPGAREIGVGDVITKVNGRAVQPGDPEKGLAGDYHVLDEAIQAATPDKPVEVTVKGADGKERTVRFRPHISPDNFGTAPVTIAGMAPRMAIGFLASEKSPLYDKARAGDAVQEVIVHSADGAQVLTNPSIKEFIERVRSAGERGAALDVTLVRDGRSLEPIKNLNLIKLETGGHGVGVRPVYDDAAAVVGEVVDDSPAKKAGIPDGATLLSVGGQAVRNWFDVRGALIGAGAAGAGGVPVTYREATGKEGEATLVLSAGDVQELKNIRHYSNEAALLTELIRVRETGNPAVALGWGAAETRDLILQFYVTLRRIASRDVGAENLMGPLGIFDAGARFAFRGTDWLLWFLAMISANLAVVNFLPIPIVDGGHFLFLLIEKAQGRPPSRRVMETAQLAGLVFIVGVFLFVTYNDIARMAGWR